jgi:hypothetical protein
VTWHVDLRNRDGSALLSDVPLAAFRAVWTLDGPGAFECELGENDAAQWLTGRRRIRVRQDATLRWQGWLTDLEESTQSFDDVARSRGTLLRAAGLGLSAVLGRRFVHGDFNKFLTSATTIAWNLVQEAQGQTDGDYGFTLGTVTGTAPNRTRHYCDGDNIADAIGELAAKDPGGFDWEIDQNGAFNAWVNGRGSASGETLERDQARTWHVRDGSTALATYVTVLGDADEPCGAPLAIRSDAGLAASYGRIEEVVELSSNDSDEMEEHGDEELRIRAAARRRVRATFHETQLPWTWGAVWLGDTVAVDLPTHFGGASQTMRVIEVAQSVEPPAEGFTEYELETV